MKCKRLLRFYFNAEALNKSLDNVILKLACEGEGGAEACAERMIELIDAKRRLAELWRYLDGVVQRFCERDVQTLEFYAFLRTGVKRLDDYKRLEVKRVTVRFTRHLRNIERYADGLRLIGEYYCLY